MIHQIPKEIVRPLLEWFSANARVLPWRSEPTPYRVWLSEIMLQQTRVEAGLPYFERFVAALPTVQALADAEEQVLMKLWEGLGYYSRARNLQKAARILVAEHGGRLPSTPQELEQLPGIGPYTAGAIASIAFGYSVPAVDGNVLRVLSRITAYEGDVLAAGVKEKTAAALQPVLPERVGDFNQALMELGALVCLPNGTPKCLVCPVREHCRARSLGMENELPVKAKKKARRTETRTIVLAVCRDRIALRRRPLDGLLAGLWEFPSLDGTLSGAQLQNRLEALGLRVNALHSAGNAKHIFSHIEWHMTGFFVDCPDFAAPEDWVWVTPQELKTEYPVPSAFRAFTEQIIRGAAPLAADDANSTH